MQKLERLSEAGLPDDAVEPLHTEQFILFIVINGKTSFYEAIVLQLFCGASFDAHNPTGIVFLFFL